jgi:NAD(P)-dependent dehydrogenase (short-subunit alcohol dehydrogenase family)
MKLENKVAIITGGGRGIGRSIAMRFAAEAASVIVSGTSREALDQTARDINTGGGRALAVRADVADESEVANLISTAIIEFGQIDVLVNNAGIAGPTAPVTKVSREEWDRTIAVNLTGAMLATKHALPHMIEQRSGRIINITSVAGLRAYALRSPYAASKWAMVGLTETLAEEVGRFGAHGGGITVNAIAPGPVDNERIRRVIAARAAEMSKDVAEVEREFLEMTRMKRLITEDEIAALALFLASEEARNITGQVIACGI